MVNKSCLIQGDPKSRLNHQASQFHNFIYNTDRFSTFFDWYNRQLNANKRRNHTLHCSLHYLANITIEKSTQIFHKVVYNDAFKVLQSL